ncbi:MAG: response regulator [Parcubacteria group bacterium]|nr:response regulator [Parcubacteria group bacterium]
MHILLVEDDQFLGNILKTKLANEGFEVTLAIDGEEGLTQAQKLKPALIILDIILPKVDGFTVLTELKKSPATKAIPIMMLTNLGQDADIAKGKALGATDYLVKANLSAGDIAKKVKEILRS